MRDEQILYKAVMKAEKNGYRGHLKLLPMFIKRDPSNKKKLTNKQFVELVSRVWLSRKNDIIFSHEFAKAFFKSTDKFSRWDWRISLADLVLDENPIKYLEKFLKK